MKYLYGFIVGTLLLGLTVFGLGAKEARAHGFVPHILQNGVTQVTTNSAVLTATIDSMHSSENGHAWFEYGTNPNAGSYAASWPWKAGIQGLPWIGQTNMAVKITNLKPHTTYYFFVKAENRNGNNPGMVLSFTTK